MKKLDLEAFNQLVEASVLKPRLKKELRFIRSTELMSDEDWHDRELLAITDRNENAGALLISLDEKFHLIAYELKKGIVSQSTGRAQPVICDFCKTWQSGNRSASIVFVKSQKPLHTISYLCCADLNCSSHVRNKTQAASISRSQLREDMTPEERVTRLDTRLQSLVTDLNIAAL